MRSVDTPTCPPFSVDCPTCDAIVGDRCADRFTPHRSRILAHRGQKTIEEQVWAERKMADFEEQWAREQELAAGRNVQHVLRQPSANMPRPQGRQHG